MPCATVYVYRNVFVAIYIKMHLQSDICVYIAMLCIAEYCYIAAYTELVNKVN